FSGTNSASLCATGARPVLMMMSSSDGATVGSLVSRSALYCTYCECSASVPGAGTACHGAHVSSGDAVLPVRMLMAIEVPGGVVWLHWIVRQSTGADASKTRDQSTTTLPPKTPRSLAATGLMRPAMVMGCVATRTPSTK